MNVELTHPVWLVALLPMLAWVVWLSWTSHATGPVWRRWAGLGVRLLIVLALGLALAGLRWRHVQEGMNVYFLLDRSDSIPANQQDSAREYVGRVSNAKQPEDNVGILVFGSEASIESSPLSVVRSDTKIYAVVGGDRTDIASAIRLGTAAFPESGQKRLVLISDGQENVGDAVSAAVAARSLGVSLEVLPLGAVREGDVAVQRVSMPANVKQGVPFEVKIFVEADGAREGVVRLYVNEALKGEQTIPLEDGKNLLTLPQVLDAPGFHQYEVRVEAAGDGVPRNNRASAFTNVRGDPRVLVVSAQPDRDEALGRALSSTNLTVVQVDIGGFPGTLAEMQSYDAIVLSNVAAGDLGENLMRLLESAVRDFGVGLVCIGGDQAFAAGGYRGTPLERALPVDMELNSKKVMPPGAVVLVMHGMEFNNGNQVARDCAIGVLQALGPQDQMGVVLWDGRERWLFPLQRVGDRKELRRAIAGMNQGDLPSFQNVLSMAHTALVETQASLKHIIVFSDGDPGPPTPELMRAIVGDRITVSSVLIAGHAGPEIMLALAEQGRGRFYHVTSPAQLPQVFIKEAAVILKSAIVEEPFRPQTVVGTEVTRGIGADEYPVLQGYVATGVKGRAEMPLVTDKGDPLLAHWQYGLGRAVAFTSDARARWAVDWLGWSKYRQFWAQVVAWALRRIENTEWIAEVGIIEGEGLLSVDALSAAGDYQDFLELQAVIVDPLGHRQLVRLDQTGPGHYEARFPTQEPGAYMINLAEIRDNRAVSAQVLGATMNYSPEFSVSGTNLPLLRTLAEAGGGRILSESSDPFSWERQRTYQPRDLWRVLLIVVVLLMPVDVGIRRVHLDPEEWGALWSRLMRWLHLRRQPVSGPAAVSLAALLASRDKARSATTPAVSVTTVQQSAPQSAGRVMSAAETAAPAGKTAEPVASAPVSTTDRLLEAKRRARSGGKSSDRER